MSRSLHTQKLTIRALRRLARPYSRRQDEADTLSRRGKTEPTDMPRLSIQKQKPLPAMQHSLTVRDIHAFLTRLGLASVYGLKLIRFRQESALRTEGIVFAEYLLSGEIHLYAVPVTPWRLPFLLHEADQAAFERYGAQCETDQEREQTTVCWSGDSLKRYALYEVLAHELGHHLLQYHKGKRAAQISRQSDHEKRADLHSRRAQKRAGKAAGCI